MDPVTLFLGAVVSAIVALVKKFSGTSDWTTGLILVCVSLVGGAGLYMLKQYNMWDAALQVLVYAGATYGLLIKNLQESQTVANVMAFAKGIATGSFSVEK